MTAPSSIASLRARLAAYPEQRYPVQHATAQLHLGMALAEAGRVADAEQSLVTALRLLDPERLPGEAAAAANAWGALLRMTGRYAEAAAAFRRAADGFAAAGRRPDVGAAKFNLGLVERESGDPEAALRALEAARPLLRAGASTAAALTREVGLTLLTLGRLGEAQAELSEAVRLAEAAGDLAGLGAAANALGLTELARGRPAEAVAAFRSAAGAHPRTVRPDGFAAAQANLALAWEQCRATPRARFAARQALATPAVPEPVRRQATEVLDRVGDDPAVVLTILDEELAERWPAVLRQELAVWTSATIEDRRGLAAAWAAGVVERPDAVEVVEHWLGAVLELPPAATGLALQALMQALAAGDEAVQQRLRALVARTLPRYPVPQWHRLAGLLNRAAAGTGIAGGWG